MLFTVLFIEDYKRVNEIKYHGRNYTSVYNHNYYYNEKNDILVLERCNDDSLFEYWEIIPLDFIFEQKEMYIGGSEGESIFDESCDNNCLGGRSEYKITSDGLHMVKLDGEFYFT